MDHADHVALIRPGVVGMESGRWADLGAGSGAFTLALADLLGGRGSIVAVDRDRRALDEGARAVQRAFPGAYLTTLVADFTAPLDVGRLDAIVMANSLHFVRDPRPVLVRLVGLLRPGGRFVLVEYDTDGGNHWVPFPMSYPTWERLAASAGLVRTRCTGRVPSRFLGAIYSAASETAAAGLTATAGPSAADT
jgi:SAM-dependent methyltransferase